MINIPSHIERCDSGTYRKRFREVDVVLINQLLTLKDERELERAHPGIERNPTHPVEHIGKSSDSSDLFDERVAEDFIPLGVTVEVLRNQLSNVRAVWITCEGPSYPFVHRCGNRQIW